MTKGVGMALGISLGFVFWLAMDNIAVGLAIGVSLGIAFEIAFKKKDGEK